jgi:Domain of unknown function (DUF4920)
MRKILSVLILTIAVSVTCFAQTTNPAPNRLPMEKESAPTTVGTMDKMKMDDKKVDEKAKAEQANWDEKSQFPMKRGAMSGTASKVSLAKILKTPAKYSGKNVLVEGLIVRSCKMEGCWLELAPNATGKSIRIKMKDHGFYVPLNAAGLKAKAEGVFTVKTLSKDEVDHLMNEDGAKFDKINADGTVTEVSFVASGLELSKGKK